jgi:ATP-dependent helicase HepA
VGVAKSLLLYQDQFVVRWSRPPQDPAVAIAHGLTEAPTYYEARSALLAQLIHQRKVSRGLVAAISAPIQLYHHQIDTAARVVGDPVLRYLLADEVGLGKTIEAGIVIRQVLIDNPAATILVLCPDSLRGQWIAELRDLLGLGDALRELRITVAAHSAVLPLATAHPVGLRHYDLVVVDEAHNLLKYIETGSRLEQQFRELDGLLALSATPMRGDPEIFRRLLALVDPVAFGDVTTASFEERLNERERSAGDVQVLATRRASVRQKTAVLDSIQTDFPDDEHIGRLVATCRTSDDAQDPSWIELADYVREIYRLSRRMIRHRRTSELTSAYSVAGRSPIFVDVADPARSVIDEFLETYRQRLDMHDSAAFARVVLHALAGPTALLDYLGRHATEDDRVLFEMTTARLELAGTGHRLAAAAEVVRSRVHERRRVVVASSFPAVLRDFETTLEEVVGHSVIHRHYHSMTPDDRDRAVEEFLGEYQGGVLLADTSIEEGRNLQESEVLVNLDLPLDVNRLEQRIGRLDRYAARPEPAEVIILTEPTSDWVSAHINLLQHGVGVFETSVSTVQRLLASLLEILLKELILKGVEAMQVDTATLHAELEAERDNIDLLEELESIEAMTAFGQQAFDELLEYERESDNLRLAIGRLTTGTGSLALKPSESPAGVLRFGSARGIGLSTAEAETLERLLHPKAIDRTAALRHPGISPFRVGDPLVDWLENYLASDERGRASAMVRPVPGLAAPALWLHCEFLLEFDAGQPAAPEGPSRRRLRHRAEAHLQPQRLETWTDASGPAPDDLLQAVLRQPFDPRQDEVLRGKTWQPVLEELPTWSSLCRQSAEAAWEEVRSSTTLAETLEHARESAGEDSRRRLAILEARTRRLPSGAEREAALEELQAERAVAEALIAGIQSPATHLVACGACVLWPSENF